MKKYFLLLLFCCLAGSTACTTAPRISILGDSYSTFKGWIPEGNGDFYPMPQYNNVRNVEECWWHIVINAIGGKLEKNDSWCGSTICHTGYEGQDASDASFVTRVGRLGDPTLILICGGTNDSWANVPLGEYMWKDWTEKDLFAFRPAMAKMLHELKRLHPEARIFFILNSNLRPEINDSVHKICAHYGVGCIDLKDIDKQNEHPSIKGMKTFADQVIKAIRQ